MWKKETTLVVRISRKELDELRAALPLLRQTGERWTLARLVREGARMLAETAGAELPDQTEQRKRCAHKGGAR